MDSLRESLSHIPFFCHQWEERSFSYKGHPFPVCARCTGVYIGQCIAVCLSFLFWVQSIEIFLLLILIVPMGIDWSLQEFCGVESTNIRRFLTGFLGGFGFYGIGILILHSIFLFAHSLF
ncbi:DUF2085 domain-containing protein [Leptospira yasudae]|nr:DUF2085 domain-containing protein [Leptospira yasudae]